MNKKTGRLTAASDDEGAVTINAQSGAVNGTVAAGGTVNRGPLSAGSVIENAGESMIFIFNKLDETYFGDYKHLNTYDGGYTLSEPDIQLDTPAKVHGETELTGNVRLDAALESLGDIRIKGEVENANNSVLCSKYGDIRIDGENVRFTGLIYAPFGTVRISAENLNLNSSVVIADKIVFTCSNLNLNGSADDVLRDIAQKTGGEFFKAYRAEDLVDIYTDIGTEDDFDRTDTDGDGLYDAVEAAGIRVQNGDIISGCDPGKADTDGDGIKDGEEIDPKPRAKNMYMAIGDPKYNPTAIPARLSLGSNYSHIDFDLYVLYVYIISNYFRYLPSFHAGGKEFGGGLSGDGLFLSNLERGLSTISKVNSMNLKTIKWNYNSDANDTLALMKEMLNDEIPFVFSYNVTFAKSKLSLYEMDENKRIVFRKKGVQPHFMNATGIIDFSQDAAALIGYNRLIQTATYEKNTMLILMSLLNT